MLGEGGTELSHRQKAGITAQRDEYKWRIY